MRALVLALFCVIALACAAPTVTTTPSPPVLPHPTTVVTPSPSPNPAVAFTCPAIPLPPLGGSPSWLPSSYCPAEEVAILAELASVRCAAEGTVPEGCQFDHPVRTITVVPDGFLCGAPFYDGTCPRVQANFGSGAYVTFVGTDEVAALTLALVTAGPLVATVVAFQVPPSGWAP